MFFLGFNALILLLILLPTVIVSEVILPEEALTFYVVPGFAALMILFVPIFAIVEYPVLTGSIVGAFSLISAAIAVKYREKISEHWKRLDKRYLGVHLASSSVIIFAALGSMLIFLLYYELPPNGGWAAMGGAAVKATIIFIALIGVLANVISLLLMNAERSRGR